jgi:hypothetical protein
MATCIKFIKILAHLDSVILLFESHGKEMILGMIKLRWNYLKVYKFTTVL